MKITVTTAEGIKDVPANELISLVEWQKKIPVCRFCGEKLSRYRVEQGSEKFYTAKHCSCEAALAAQKHNRAIDPFFDETSNH